KLSSPPDRNNKPRKVVCYDISWQNPGESEGIDLNVCTHINFAFATMHDNTIQLSNANGKPFFDSFFIHYFSKYMFHFSSDHTSASSSQKVSSLDIVDFNWRWFGWLHQVLAYGSKRS